MFRFFLLLFSVLLPETLMAQRGAYIANALLTPLHDQRGQLQVRAGWGGGYGLDVSYSVTNHIALFSSAKLDGGTRNHTTILGSTYVQHNNNHVLQGGLGYFKQFDRRYLNRVEMYTGAGTSSVDNSWYYTRLSDSKEFTRARYWTAFSQINLGKRGRSSDIIFGMRLAYSHYQDFAYYDNHPNVRYIRYRYEQVRVITLEPAVSYGYRWRGFKAAVQGGVALPLATSEANLVAVHTTDAGSIVRSMKESPSLGALLGQISLQYRFDLNKKDKPSSEAD